jgi:hypothetical protein
MCGWLGRDLSRLAAHSAAWRAGPERKVLIAPRWPRLTLSSGSNSRLEWITAKVLERPVAEMADWMRTADPANSDEAAWQENGSKPWLSVVVTSPGIIFRIARSPAPWPRT